MHPYVERLRQELDKAQPCYGYSEADSLLEMLYMWYVEWNPINSDQIQRDFFSLEAYMSGCSEKQIDEAQDIVSCLCQNHEKLAFLEGIRVGVRLAAEL